MPVKLSGERPISKAAWENKRVASRERLHACTTRRPSVIAQAPNAEPYSSAIDIFRQPIFNP
jgi:hypothetical protein